MEIAILPDPVDGPLEARASVTVDPVTHDSIREYFFNTYIKLRLGDIVAPEKREHDCDKYVSTNTALVATYLENVMRSVRHEEGAASWGGLVLNHQFFLQVFKHLHRNRGYVADLSDKLAGHTYIDQTSKDL